MSTVPSSITVTVGAPRAMVIGLMAGMVAGFGARVLISPWWFVFSVGFAVGFLAGMAK